MISLYQHRPEGKNNKDFLAKGQTWLFGIQNKVLKKMFSNIITAFLTNIKWLIGLNLSFCDDGMFIFSIVK